MSEAPTTITAYKAFDGDLKCRGFQFAIGETYEIDGEPAICRRGFHACENPFDVFNYYPLGSRVARVTATGTVSREDNGDTKLCAAKLTVEAELRVPEIIQAAVDWIVEAAKGNIATGHSGRAAATGYRGHAAATGDSGRAAATGYRGHAAATGASGRAAAAGYSGHAAATGYRGHAAATGDSGRAAATGYRGHAAAAGDSGHAAATGDRGHAAATGDSGHAAATGHASVACAPGIEASARAEVGGAISLAAYSWNTKAGRYDLVAVRSSLVGENGVEAGKTYRLTEDGEFKQVTL